MKKALSIAKEIAKDYSQSIENKRYRPVSCQSIGNHMQDKFSVNSVSGQVSIEASNPLAAAYAISQVRMGLLSGHLPEYLQEQQPLYPLRPLWIGCQKLVSVSDKVGIWLPDFFLEKNKKTFELFCRRLIELGFNALILGQRGCVFCEKSPVVFKELALLHRMLSEYGIRLILKPSVFYRDDEKELFFLPTHPSFQNKVTAALTDLLESVPALDELLWESVYFQADFQRHPLGREFTKLEKVAAELKCVEALGVPLIFYLPCQDLESAEGQSEWIPLLLNEMGPKTTFAFSAVAGDPQEDHCPAHPLWERLRGQPRIASTPLLPLLNSGAVGQGEGLWPGLTFDLVEEFYSRCLQGHYRGIVSLAAHLPREGSLADCNLWVAGQRLWRTVPALLLAQSWFAVKRADIDFQQELDLFKNTRALIKSLSFLRSLNGEKNRDLLNAEEQRCYSESLLAQLKYLELAVKKYGVCSGRTSLKAYYQFFICEARRWIAEGESAEEVKSGEPGTLLHQLLWESRIEVD